MLRAFLVSTPTGAKLDGCSFAPQGAREGGSTAPASPARVEAHPARAGGGAQRLGGLYGGSGGGPAAPARAGTERSVRAHDEVPAAASQRPAHVRAGGAGGGREWGPASTPGGEPPGPGAVRAGAAA